MENKAQKLLESLTPGGSEFVNDPEYCVKYVKDYQESQLRSIKNLVLQKNKLIKENLELLKALQDLNTAIDNYWNADIKSDYMVKSVNIQQQKSLAVIQKATT